eukprot:gene203-biopygen12
MARDKSKEAITENLSGDVATQRTVGHGKKQNHGREGKCQQILRHCDKCETPHHSQTPLNHVCPPPVFPGRVGGNDLAVPPALEVLRQDEVAVATHRLHARLLADRRDVRGGDLLRAWWGGGGGRPQSIMPVCPRTGSFIEFGFWTQKYLYGGSTGLPHGTVDKRCVRVTPSRTPETFPHTWGILHSG